MRLYASEDMGHVDCSPEDIVKISEIDRSYGSDLITCVTFRHKKKLSNSAYEDRFIWFIHTPDEIRKMIEIEKFNESFEDKLK